MKDGPTRTALPCTAPLRTTLTCTSLTGTTLPRTFMPCPHLAGTGLTGTDTSGDCRHAHLPRPAARAGRG